MLPNRTWKHGRLTGKTVKQLIGMGNILKKHGLDNWLPHQPSADSNIIVNTGQYTLTQIKLRQGYFWPVYGEADEIAFSYTPAS